MQWGEISPTEGWPAWCLRPDVWCTSINRHYQSNSDALTDTQINSIQKAFHSSDFKKTLDANSKIDLFHLFVQSFVDMEDQFNKIKDKDVLILLEQRISH